MSSQNPGPRATDRQTTRASERSAALDARLVRFMERLCAGGFYGKVTLSLQNGKVVDVRTEQTTKLEEL